MILSNPGNTAALSNSADPFDSSNPMVKELGVAAKEIAATSLLANMVSHAGAIGIGQVVVATAGATAITVSLPAVVASGAALCLGLSLGRKMIKVFNHNSSN